MLLSTAALCLCCFQGAQLGATDRDCHKAASILALNLGRNTLPKPAWAHRQAVGVSSPTLMSVLSDKPDLLFKPERSSCTQQTVLTWSTGFKVTL